MDTRTAAADTAAGATADTAAAHDRTGGAGPTGRPGRPDGTGAAIEVLAEPNRRRILDLLRDGELPVGDLVERLGMSQPAVSKHLRVLREAGLVEARAQAQRRLYRIRPEPLAELDAWLAPYRSLWAHRLDLLARHLAGPRPDGGPDPEERTHP